MRSKFKWRHALSSTPQRLPRVQHVACGAAKPWAITLIGSSVDATRRAAHVSTHHKHHGSCSGCHEAQQACARCGAGNPKMPRGIGGLVCGPVACAPSVGGGGLG